MLDFGHFVLGTLISVDCVAQPSFVASLFTTLVLVMVMMAAAMTVTVTVVMTMMVFVMAAATVFFILL